MLEGALRNVYCEIQLQLSYKYGQKAKSEEGRGGRVCLYAEPRCRTHPISKQFYLPHCDHYTKTDTIHLSRRLLVVMFSNMLANLYTS